MNSVQMSNGSVLKEEKIDKLVGFIINKFAEEKISVDEAKAILKNTEDLVGEFSKVTAYRFLSNIS